MSSEEKFGANFEPLKSPRMSSETPTPRTTPRTDAAKFTVLRTSLNYDRPDEIEVIDPDDMAQLERELAAARAENANLRGLLGRAQQALSISSPMTILYQNGNHIDMETLKTLSMQIHGCDMAIRATLQGGQP